MSAPEFHRINIELRFDGAAPTGCVRLAGGDPHGFSGWVGLVNAVEELVTEDPELVGAPPDQTSISVGRAGIEPAHDGL